MIVLDANILLRMADRLDPQHELTISAVFKKRLNDELVILPQSLYEFGAVATRSLANNGLGMDSARLTRWITRYRAMFQLLSEPPDLIDRWQAVISQFRITGFQVHDARYVAAMQGLNLRTFMTHNLRHFKNYPIDVLDPRTV